MSNFEYIISSLPYLTADYKYEDGEGFRSVIDQILSNLSEKDAGALEFLLKGFDADELNPDFYARALSHPVKFLREYFRFDLMLRNAKVRYLNRELGRPEETDIVNPWNEEEGEEAPLWEFEEQRPIQLALEGTSLLEREKELDDITWEKVSSLETFHYFDLTAVLAYVAKLHIVDRWLALDEEKGRELFHKLVREVKGTFAGVNYQGKEEENR